MTTEPGPWVQHCGGGRPHPPSTTVEVQLRNGQRMAGVSAFLYWPWEVTPAPEDVVAYREVPQEYGQTIAQLIQSLADSGAAVTLIFRPQDRINSNVFAYLTHERLWESFLRPEDKRDAAMRREDLVEIEVKLGDRTLQKLSYDHGKLVIWAAIQVREMANGREAA